MISGQYVKTFDEATHGMLDGANLNAHYDFYWAKITKIEGSTLHVKVNGKDKEFPFQRTKNGDRARVSVQDRYRLFPPQSFWMVPFKGTESR
jgi:hypothetical protein